MFTQTKYTCQICNYSINDELEIFNSVFEKPDISDTKRYKIYGDIKSLLLGEIQIHHIKPLSQNGKHSPSNLIVLCDNCHISINKIENHNLNKKSKFSKIKHRVLDFFKGNILGDFSKKKLLNTKG